MTKRSAIRRIQEKISGIEGGDRYKDLHASRYTTSRNQEDTDFMNETRGELRGLRGSLKILLAAWWRKDKS